MPDVGCCRVRLVQDMRTTDATSNGWTSIAQRIQAIAQTGLAYAINPHDVERYRENFSGSCFSSSNHLFLFAHTLISARESTLLRVIPRKGNGINNGILVSGCR